MKFIQTIFIFYLIFKLIFDCDQYENYYTCGQNSGTENDWNSRCFQTPKREETTDDPVYVSTYQDMHYLVGYTQIRYNQNKDICKVIIYTKVNTAEVDMNTYKLFYTFGETEQESDYFIVSKYNDTFPDGLNISVRLAHKDTKVTFAKLELEEEYFVWNVPNFDYDNQTLREKGQNLGDKYDGDILVPFSIESPLSGVGKSLKPGMSLFYNKKVDLF